MVIKILICHNWIPVEKLCFQSEKKFEEPHVLRDDLYIIIFRTLILLIVLHKLSMRFMLPYLFQ